VREGRRIVTPRALGGPETVSTQQLVLVEKAVTQKLIVDSLDATRWGWARQRGRPDRGHARAAAGFP